MGYVVKHVPLAGLGIWHPSLPTPKVPQVPSSPFRKPSAAPSPVQPTAQNWDAYWAGKAPHITALRTALAVGGEAGMPGGTLCSMMLDNYVAGDLSLGASLFDALEATRMASKSEYQGATKQIEDDLGQVHNWLLAGLLKVPTSITGAPAPTTPATQTPPDQQWVDNSVPAGQQPGTTSAIPGGSSGGGGTVTPYGMPASSATLIPGVPNLALVGGGAALAAFFLMRRK